ncbi:AAA family ATPase [Dysosmobacter sp.]|uniref:AAA family ATPase n=1 Tax=Dysosmobacter sp. TaxID=2591382 RepID=UPI002A8D0C14|nr:AAA family ATPase [Dysosmobacter sp.]MDY3282752.1 AAA family ATPase [Dysosmobacter sp.]
MSDYRVTLLGTPGVYQDGELVRFPYRKAEGILYYLCVEKNASRDELVSFFWGSCDEESGRKNLRQALFQIRRCLGEDIIILQGRNDLKLNQRCGVRTDWDAPDPEFALSRERFLDFFYLKDCPEFDAWVEQKRELQISRSLSYIENQLKDPAVCRDTARLQQLTGIWQFWRPWDEEMVLAGMKCFAQAEKYDLGLQLYQEYAKRLQDDLAETPSHAVELLYRTLLHRKKVASLRRPGTRDSFFGRRAELQFIDERLFWFLNEESTVSVVIGGEVGVGKTALMQQIFEMNCDSGVLQLSSHCYSVEEEFPLKAWRDLFVQLENLCAAGTVRLSEGSLSLLPVLLSGRITGEDGDDGRTSAALIDGVLRLFKELVSRRKIILYFDSLQWMDPVSRQLLQRIMIEFGNDQVFLIATCRTDEQKQIRGLLLALQERNLITTLTLSPFTEEETAAIIREVLQDPAAGGADAHQLYLRTEGNPLVLMETLNVIRQEGWKKDCPLPRIDLLIQLRLDRLTPQQRRVLDALSIHFEHANLEDLEILTGLPPMELIELLDQLLTAGFIAEQPWGSGIVYKFRHQFYKDYVHQNLSMGKRQLWHRAVAEFYDTQKTGDRWRILLPYTIRHYEYGGNPERTEALRNLQGERPL